MIELLKAIDAHGGFTKEDYVYAEEFDALYPGCFVRIEHIKDVLSGQHRRPLDD